MTERSSKEKIVGKLKISPELSWAEIKNSPYLHVAHWHLVGRSSGVTSNCALEIKDVYLEESDTFTKASEYVHVGVDYWNVDMRSVIADIKRLMARFPEHTFTGRVDWTRDDREIGMLIVRDGEITWMEPTTVWVLHAEKAQHTVSSRWLPDQGWVDDPTLDRLGQANELLSRMHRLMTIDWSSGFKEHLRVHEEQRFCDDDGCLISLVREHLAREGR